MKRTRLLDHFVVRNFLGLAALLAAHYLTDFYAIEGRPGFSKVSPYLYLLLLYGWIVFHNRILFERLFLQDKKMLYFGWFFLLMVLGSFNMNFVLRTEFSISRSLPYLVNFWVYTITGLGVFVTYRYLRIHAKTEELLIMPAMPASDESGHFSCMVDGVREAIPYTDIQYIESLENYLKVITKAKTYVTRLTLKEAEERLPKRQFIRISRSCIVHITQVDRSEPDAFWIGAKELRVGKVYKRYVAEQLSG
ncbi:LytR/AlgR family response regulator transcription factor [Spirosoma endbachense]|uniref:LytTR family transcriptional regulator n=1 Tax=Spirosoma endbachense TaxID=2666025 RepID=A0A6P1W6C5_9BACT|nr:LytTR family DNA-binding domain-containing protein [Spirosoma endbachense]QHV99902.1 LytTR family transcriptional regulator [Spirosoma endbachense]